MVTKKLINRKSKKAITTCKKMKIQKKMRTANKRMRKEAKKSRMLGFKKRKGKSELKLPNLFPQKKELLETLLRRKNGDLGLIENIQSKSITIDTSREGNDPDFNPVADKLLTTDHHKQAMKNFRSLNYVLENADVIIEVLDARYPDACRCRALEKRLAAKYVEKKLILVLNKIDLVPLEVCLEWQKHLSSQYPTVLFRANQQEQRSSLSNNKLFKNSLEKNPELVSNLLNSSKSVGSEKLLELIKNYARNDSGGKSAITVGVVGYPNVGKSSIINSLARRKASPVSNVAGFTKSIQRVEIDKKVDIIDCPGIIPNVEDETTLLLRNTIKPENVSDVEGAVAELIKLIDKSQLIDLYKVPDFESAQELLIKVAEVRGKLKKGGIFDLQAAGKIILHDWCQGSLKYYTFPPKATSLDHNDAAMRVE